MAIAVPSHLTPLIDKYNANNLSMSIISLNLRHTGPLRCVDALENLGRIPEAVSVYSAA